MLIVWHCCMCLYLDKNVKMVNFVYIDEQTLYKKTKKILKTLRKCWKYPMYSIIYIHVKIVYNALQAMLQCILTNWDQVNALWKKKIGNQSLHGLLYFCRSKISIVRLIIRSFVNVLKWHCWDKRDLHNAN